jgi:hypothetical protein
MGLLFGAQRAQKNLPLGRSEEASYRSDKAVGVISSFEQFRGNSIPINLLANVLMSVARFNCVAGVIRAEQVRATLRALPPIVRMLLAVDATHAGFAGLLRFKPAVTRLLRAANCRPSVASYLPSGSARRST